MNIELSVKEENGIVKIKITSPDKPVVIETTATEKDAEETAKAKIDALSEKLTAMNREYGRVKKAAWRARKRLEAILNTSGQTLSSTDAGCPALVPAHVPTVPNPVPGDSPGQEKAVTAYSNINTINHNHVTDHDMNQITTNNPGDGTEPAGNCPPFTRKGAGSFLPLSALPVAYRAIVTAWNGLPLPKKLKGLYPDVMETLHTRLQEFGEASLQKAIRMVGESPFLLGQSDCSSGWVINFSWLLKPGNLQKVLDNKYRNREADWERHYCGAARPDYDPWANAETCYLDPSVMTEGLTKLSSHTQHCLEQAARTLGLKKEAVVA